jgi:hypothetical protein
MMGVLFGVLLQGCFFLAAALVSLFVVLLRYPCGATLSGCTAKDQDPKISPDAGARERVKRPAFLPST